MALTPKDIDGNVAYISGFLSRPLVTNSRSYNEENLQRNVNKNPHHIYFFREVPEDFRDPELWCFLKDAPRYTPIRSIFLINEVEELLNSGADPVKAIYFVRGDTSAWCHDPRTYMVYRYVHGTGLELSSFIDDADKVATNKRLVTDMIYFVIGDTSQWCHDPDPKPEPGMVRVWCPCVTTHGFQLPLDSGSMKHYLANPDHFIVYYDKEPTGFYSTTDYEEPLADWEKELLMGTTATAATTTDTTETWTPKPDDRVMHSRHGVGRVSSVQNGYATVRYGRPNFTYYRNHRFSVLEPYQSPVPVTPRPEPRERVIMYYRGNTRRLGVYQGSPESAAAQAQEYLDYGDYDTIYFEAVIIPT